MSNILESEWTPEVEEKLRKRVAYVQGWGHPQTGDIERFVSALEKNGVTKGQLHFNDYTSPEFNSKIPTRFRFRGGIVDSHTEKELFIQRTAQVAEKLGFQIVPKCKLISYTKVSLKLMCSRKAGSVEDAQNLEPRLGEVVEFASALQGNGDITDRVMHNHHFGCECHDLGDVTGFGIRRISEAYTRNGEWGRKK